MQPKNHRVMVVNPRPRDGNAKTVIRSGQKFYLIKPISSELYEIYYNKKYLGESTSLSGVDRFIQRCWASAPVLIQNTNGGYEMYQYKSPVIGGETKNPKKKSKKKASKKRAKKAGKKVGKKKAKKA